MRKLCIALALTFAPSAGAAYKCVDERGITHVGDTPPPGCAKVMMYEVTRQGRVVRNIPPSLTAEQVKVRNEEIERKKEADKLAAEQKRKDTALLASFSTAHEFDVARDRNIEPITARVKLAGDRIKEIDARLAKLEEEMEFYKAGKKRTATSKPGKRTDEAPPMMVAEVERLTKEKSNLQRQIATYEREIVTLRERFDIDKQRWVLLKSGGGSRRLDAAPEEKPDAAPATKAAVKR